MAKAKQHTIQGIGSKSYVFPSYWELTGKPWSAVEAVSKEQARLMERYIKLGRERLELLAELDYQRRQHYEEELAAVRKDEDPQEPQYVRLTEKAIERVDQKMKALQAVAQGVNAEYHQALDKVKGNEELVEEFEAEGKKHHQEYLRLVAEAERERDLMGVFLGLSRFVALEQQEFGPPPSDAVSRPWWQQNVVWPSDPHRTQP
jgi:cytochrome c556